MKKLLKIIGIVALVLIVGCGAKKKPIEDVKLPEQVKNYRELYMESVNDIVKVRQEYLAQVKDHINTVKELMEIKRLLKECEEN